MHQGERLKWFVDRSALNNEDIARLSEISEATLYNYLKASEIPSKKLKKILEVLKIDLETFGVAAAEPAAVYTVRLKMLEEQNEILKKQLADKEEIICLLKNKK